MQFDNNKNLGKLGGVIEKVLKDGEYVLGGPEKRDYGAAGIIPFDKNGNKIYFLLAKVTGKDIWTYFGGHKEDKDNENPRATAIREAYEESYDIIRLNKHLPINKQLEDNGIINNMMRNGKFVVIPRYTKSKKWWNNIYFMRINKESWIRKHHDNNYKFKNGSHVKNNEIDEMRWFSIVELFILVKNGKIAGFLTQPIIKFIDIDK